MVLHIGTSGWIYEHWRGVFYPERLPQREWLDFYAREFDTVEINFTFYRLPSRETFQSWRDRAAPAFSYAVKGSRFVTHLKRLRDPEQHVGRFFERLQGLGDRAGPILWQLPPNFHRNDERLRGFLAALPREYRHAIEFRHASWLVEAVFAHLAEDGLALCIPDRPDLPQTVRLTANWTYVRFHGGTDEGGSYTAAQLDDWAERIRAFLARGAAVWVYFNNDWHGHAIRNARDLRARLAGEAALKAG